MARGDQVDFCGGCKREFAYGTNRCPYCGKMTVSMPDNESHSSATARWKKKNGK